MEHCCQFAPDDICKNIDLLKNKQKNKQTNKKKTKNDGSDVAEYLSLCLVDAQFTAQCSALTKSEQQRFQLFNIDTTKRRFDFNGSNCYSNTGNNSQFI